MEQTRDERLAAFRKSRSTVVNDIQQFDLQTVQPIIQLQSALLFSQVRNAVYEKHKAFNAFNQKEQKRLVKLLLAQEIQLRQSLIHTITSLFTLEEFEFYKQHEFELNKRTAKNIEERLHQNLEKLL